MRIRLVGSLALFFFLQSRVEAGPFTRKFLQQSWQRLDPYRGLGVITGYWVGAPLGYAWAEKSQSYADKLTYVVGGGVGGAVLGFLVPPLCPFLYAYAAYDIAGHRFATWAQDIVPGAGE